MEDMKHSILTQVLDQSARARCNLLVSSISLQDIVLMVSNPIRLSIVNTLCLGKPEKGRMVEEMLLSMAQRGQLPGKLGEKELISLLESVNQQTQKKTTVKVSIVYNCASNRVM